MADENKNLENENNEEEISPDAFADSYFKNAKTKEENYKLVDQSEYKLPIPQDTTQNNEFPKTNLPSTKTDPIARQPQDPEHASLLNNSNSSNQGSPKNSANSTNSLSQRSKNNTDGNTAPSPLNQTTKPNPIATQYQEPKQDSSPNNHDPSNQKTPNNLADSNDPPIQRDKDKTDGNTAPNSLNQTTKTDPKEMQSGNTKPDSALNYSNSSDKNSEEKNEPVKKPITSNIQVPENQEKNNSEQLDEDKTPDQTNIIGPDSPISLDQQVKLVRYIHDLKKNADEPEKLAAGLEEVLKQKNLLKSLIDQTDNSSDDLLQELNNASSDSEIKKILQKMVSKDSKYPLASIIEDILKKRLEQLNLEELNDLLNKTTEDNLRRLILALLAAKNYNKPVKYVEEAKNNARKGLIPEIPDNTPYSAISNQKPSLPKNLEGNQEEGDSESNDQSKSETSSNAGQNQTDKKDKPTEDQDNKDKTTDETDTSNVVDKATELGKKTIKAIIVRLFFTPPLCFITWAIFLFITIFITVLMAGSVITNCVVNFDVQSEKCSSLVEVITDDVKKSILGSVGVAGDELEQKISNMVNPKQETPADAAKSNSGISNPSA